LEQDELIYQQPLRVAFGVWLVAGPGKFSKAKEWL
jgi:hypothetical protein